MIRLFCILVCAGFLALPLSAAVATGENAPELPGSFWIGKEKPVKLADCKGKKAVVLFFWGMEPGSFNVLPHLEKLMRPYSARAELVGIGCGRKEALEKFPLLKRMHFPVFADEKLVYTKLMLRDQDRVPVAAVVDKEGRVAWRGKVELLPQVLPKILRGKFDIAERARQEAFSVEVSTLMMNKEYEKALVKVQEELKRNPGNRELVSVQVLLLHRYLKRDAEAFAAIEAARKSRPLYLPLYEMEWRLIGTKDPEKRGAFYRRVAADFREQPLVLLKFAEQELSLPEDRSRPEFYCMLGDAAWKAPKFRDDREKGIVALQYAKLLHCCSRVDLALRLTKAAQPLLKGKKEEKAAKSALQYYQNILRVTPTLKVDVK